MDTVCCRVCLGISWNEPGWRGLTFEVAFISAAFVRAFCRAVKWRVHSGFIHPTFTRH